MGADSRDALEKTTRINMLFDIYGPLLTEKQMDIMTYYFREDFSLGEIAAELGVSRQAVYEHVKRGGLLLEEYEAKIGLLGRSLSAALLLDNLDHALSEAHGMAASEARRIQGLARELREALLPGAQNDGT
ncbi:hypothetical protein SAMN05444162_4357 [Paenibacillaceae bacterium GAS479]|nr:hypothetical protein SAMN05444162_4357 [Paenibacillaceae bacterium GAS479]